MQPDELFDTVREGPARILPRVPLRGADRREKPLHLRLVGQELPVEMARVPFDQNAADVEHNRLDAVIHATNSITCAAARAPESNAPFMVPT